MPYRRHRQRLRHDPSQHGHHALLCHHRCSHLRRRFCKRRSAEVVDDTFNMVSVDGDTSTNDMLSVLANGLAGNPVITEGNPGL